MFVADDESPPVKTAQIHLPTDNTNLQHLQQLPQQQQQLVTSSIQQRQQQQSHKCIPHKRFQQQPLSSQRCHQQPQLEHQVAREPSSTASAVDRSVRSSTRGGCTEVSVKPDVQPEQHPTCLIASIKARDVDETVGCADVTMRPSEGHVHLSSHVSAAHDVTAVLRSTINNPGRLNTPGSSTAGRKSSRSVPSKVFSQQKLKGERKNALKSTIYISRAYGQQQHRHFAHHSPAANSQLHGVDSTSKGAMLWFCGCTSNESMTSSMSAAKMTSFEVRH